MYRRRALALLIGLAAGCSTQPGEPTATADATGTADATPTVEAPDDGDATATAGSDATATPGGVDGVVATLNAMYADLGPFLESLETDPLDAEALGAQLDRVEAGVASAREAGAADEARLQSLADTRWVFDRLVRTAVRLDEAYAVHEDVNAAYRASETSAETTADLDRLGTLADEAASAMGAAVSRFDDMDGLDPGLSVEYDRFEDELLRVADTANSLTPFTRGLRAAIPAREGYLAAVESYEAGSYREARDAFTDLLSRFTDARDRFEGAAELTGPLEAPYRRYVCESSAARIACTDYRAACREQLDGDADAADRRRQQAEERYGECDA